jgi:hypothetical protein
LKRNICLAALTLLALTPLPGRTQAPASDAQKQPINPPQRGKEPRPITRDMRTRASRSVIIPELTEVSVILKDEIQSGGNKVGSELLFFVAKDVYGPGHDFLIARGTPVLGHIVESQAYQNFGRAGKLVLRCEYILAQDKTRIPLRGVHQESRGRARNGDAALIGLAGGVSGAIVDLFVYGKDAKLHIGKTYKVYVNADTLTDAPIPNEEPDENDAPQKAFALLKNGGWAVGFLRTEGDTYVFTNSAGTYPVQISDVLSLQYLKDATIPTGK